MANRDTLILSHGEDSDNKIFHVSRDSLDEELNKLSLAISRKQLEFGNDHLHDSQQFTLNDICEDEDNSELELEKLRMRIEDLESFINCRMNFQYNQENTYIPKKEGFGVFPRTSFLDFSNTIEHVNLNAVECSIVDLYYLIEEIFKVIKLAENELKFIGRLTLGNLKLDVRVIKDDALVADKEELAEQFSKYSDQADKTKNFDDLFTENPIFYMFEQRLNEAYDKFIFLDPLQIEIGKNSAKLMYSNKNSVINFLEYCNQRNIKLEESTKIRELEWQTAQARAKKSAFYSKSKKIFTKEEELRKLNRNISQQTIKNAKERELLEEEIEHFERQKDELVHLTNTRLEIIRKVLQEIEDVKVEEKNEVERMNKSHIGRNYESPSIIKEVPIETQIKLLQTELVKLEYEYKSSSIPETLETISTNIDRVKSNLLNLQSLKVIKSTERTSSAMRSRYKVAERNLHEFSSDHTSSTKETDNYGKQRILPHPPTKAPGIRLSPVRMLEVSTTRLDTSTLNSPSRRTSPFLARTENKEDIELKKYLRKMEQELKEREEELEYEERKLQEVWEQVPQGREMIPAIQHEIFEYRKLKKEVQTKFTTLEREKFEWRERFRNLESREKELKQTESRLKDNENEFEYKKDQIFQKLEWLKRKLVQ